MLIDNFFCSDVGNFLLPIFVTLNFLQTTKDQIRGAKCGYQSKCHKMVVSIFDYVLLFFDLQCFGHSGVTGSKPGQVLFQKLTKIDVN